MTVSVCHLHSLNSNLGKCTQYLHRINGLQLELVEPVICIIEIQIADVNLHRVKGLQPGLCIIFKKSFCVEKLTFKGRFLS